jgi:hypothetical protein
VGVADSFRDMAQKAKEKISPEKAKQGVERAGDKVDEATGGKYGKYVDRGQQAAKSGVDRMSDREENEPR